MDFSSGIWQVIVEVNMNRAFWPMMLGFSALVILVVYGLNNADPGSGKSFLWMLLGLLIVAGAVFGLILLLVSQTATWMRWNIPARILTFGTVSGLMWSFVVGGLLDFNWHPTVLTLVACPAIGILVTLVLYPALAASGPWRTLLFGVVALPLGAFCYGMCSALPDTGAVDPVGRALTAGFTFAVFSLWSGFSVFLLPLAILNTYALRNAIQRGGGENQLSKTELMESHK